MTPYAPSSRRVPTHLPRGRPAVCRARVRPFPQTLFFQAEDGIRDVAVTGVQTCAHPIYPSNDTLQHLVDYIGQFAVGFLGASRIRCFVDLPDEMPGRIISSEVRHHLF